MYEFNHFPSQYIQVKFCLNLVVEVLYKAPLGVELFIGLFLLNLISFLRIYPHLRFIRRQLLRQLFSKCNCKN